MEILDFGAKIGNITERNQVYYKVIHVYGLLFSIKLDDLE